MRGYYAHDLGRGRARGRTREESTKGRARGEHLDSIIGRLIQDEPFSGSWREDCSGNDCTSAGDFNSETRR